jgi:CRP/FNR family cyclic AMP-dependent transcriptional regulator
VKKKIELFKEQNFLAKINGGKSELKFTPKKPIFRQGDPADAIFYIATGRVKLTVVSKRGREAVVAVLDAGDFIDEGCMAGQPLRVVTAWPMAESRLVRIEKDSATAALKADPAFSERFLSYLLIRNRRIQEDLVDQLFNSSEKRLARVLLLLANYGKEQKPDLVIGKISQEVLAEMIGTTRSRVSHFMNKFRKLGFVKYNGELEVHSSLLTFILDD